jgi:hypothetical protein
MTCPGLHCPGCTEGQSLAITGGGVVGLVLAAETVQWVAERVWWIGGTMAVCLALSVAVSMSLEAWADRRGARFAAAHGILSRADVILPEAARAVVVEPAASRPAIAPTYILNFYGTDSGDMAARVIRAIPGTARDAIATEGNK